ncbi:hypothetical protein [Plantactinospora sp. DSM 117369]
MDRERGGVIRYVTGQTSSVDATERGWRASYHSQGGTRGAHITAAHLRGATVMTSGEIIRLRRQMQRRIRAVVAERRMARNAAPIGAIDDPGPDQESRTQQHVDG